jgi:hypothetical protein
VSGSLFGKRLWLLSWENGKYIFPPKIFSTLLSSWRRVARVFLVQHTKAGKIYTKLQQKYTKCPYNRLNGHKIYQHLPLQDHPKFTQVGIFGLKIYHLVTLELGAIFAPVSKASTRVTRWVFLKPKNYPDPFLLKLIQSICSNSNSSSSFQSRDHFQIYFCNT